MQPKNDWTFSYLYVAYFGFGSQLFFLSPNLFYFWHKRCQI